MCQQSIVDTAMRTRIAAHGAEFRRASESPFGSEDQIGMLNLIDSSSRRAILSGADAGAMLDLSVDYFVGMPCWDAAGDPSYQMWMTHTPRGTELDDAVGVGENANQLISYSGDAVSMYTHCGTHVDALNHFGYNGEIFNRYRAHDHLGSRHWRVSGADRHPPILARGVLLDVAALHGVDILPTSYGIGPDDLADCARQQRVEIRPGDVVLVRTGRMRLWPDAELYLRDEPGITLEGARFLAEKGAVLIGSDTLGLEQRPSADPDNWNVVHCFLLAEAGVTIMEVANLEAVSAERIYEFAFFGACIRFRGATGAPIRPVIMPLREK